MATAEAALARLCDPGSEVSAHYLISGQGEVWQLVAEEARAWHAGAGSWRGVSDLNSCSIGIELDNNGATPFADPQMAALESLLHRVMRQWDILPEGVIAHSDLAPGRKMDPGPRFDWARLARQGLAGPTGGRPVTDEAALRQLGYTADVSTDGLVAAHRLRHGAWLGQGPIA